MIRKAVLAAALIFVSRCSHPFSPDEPSLQDLLAAPEEIVIYGRSVILETYLRASHQLIGAVY